MNNLNITHFDESGHRRKTLVLVAVTYVDVFKCYLHDLFLQNPGPFACTRLHFQNGRHAGLVSSGEGSYDQDGLKFEAPCPG